MKTKNIVAFLTTVMTCLCLYHLSFTWMDIKMNQRAIAVATDEKGNVDLYKKQEYLDSYWDKCAYKIFGREYTYEQIKNKTLNLGLDLQGGMSVTLEILIDDLIVKLANNNHKDVIFSILKDKTPAGASTSTTSFFFLPSKAFPIGDSFEILLFARSTSVEPTIVYSTFSSYSISKT